MSERREWHIVEPPIYGPQRRLLDDEAQAKDWFEGLRQFYEGVKLYRVLEVRPGEIVLSRSKFLEAVKRAWKDNDNYTISSIENELFGKEGEKG